MYWKLVYRLRHPGYIGYTQTHLHQPWRLDRCNRSFSHSLVMSARALCQVVMRDPGGLQVTCMQPSRGNEQPCSSSCNTWTT